MEADLRWRYHVDYRDVPWRSRAALIRHLPPDSAVGAVERGGPYWSVEAHLLDELRITLLATAGADKKFLAPHPDRPQSRRPPDPARMKKFSDARRRARERRRMIEAGEIT